jgi:hypothetical protein
MPEIGRDMEKVSFLNILKKENHILKKKIRKPMFYCFF